MGPVDGYTMTSLISAIGDNLGKNTLLFCHPEKPFVNVGYHQEVWKEVNVDFCIRKGIPIVRRPLGGGTIVDGPWEQDFFIFVKRGEIRGTVKDFYQKYLYPIVAALQFFGLMAGLKGNDLIVRDKKIGGTGAVDTEKARVLAGDILLDLDIDMMTHAINVPDEKFLDKLAGSIEEWLTSLRKEGLTMGRAVLKECIVNEFQRRLDIEFYSGNLTSKEEGALKKLVEDRQKKDWIFCIDNKKQRKLDEIKRIKISRGVYLAKKDFKFSKLVSIMVCVGEGELLDISLTGDFFVIPPAGIEAVEEALKGTKLDRESLIEKIRGVIKESNINIIGFTPEELAEAIASLS